MTATLRVRVTGIHLHNFASLYRASEYLCSYPTAKYQLKIAANVTCILNNVIPVQKLLINSIVINQWLYHNILQLMVVSIKKKNYQKIFYCMQFKIQRYWTLKISGLDHWVGVCVVMVTPGIAPFALIVLISIDRCHHSKAMHRLCKK